MFFLSSFISYLVPIIIMVGLIPVVTNDFILTGIYAIITALFVSYRFEKIDLVMLLFGIVGLTISEYFFISTGVEVFLRTSLFGVMPLWLPLLWGCSFVSIKRCIVLLGKIK